MTSYTGHRQSPAELVCAPTREEHDAIVAITGRPFTQDCMSVRSAGLPDGDPVSLIDTYIHESQRGGMKL